MPTFPARAAERLGVDQDAVRALLTGDAFRERYWGGTLPESAFWDELGVTAPDPVSRHGILSLSPRIDATRVAGWRERAEVWIISNHRHEWLLPVLEEAGFDRVVDRVEVSSIGGRVKPDPAAWAVLLGDGADPADVLVVDDQERNLEAARSLGITAIAATGGAGWADGVDDWLAGRP